MATTPNPTSVFYWTSDGSTIGGIGIRSQYNPITQTRRDQGENDPNGNGNVIAVRGLVVSPDLDLGDIDPVSGGRIYQIVRKLETRQRVRVFFVLPETNVNYSSALDAVNKFKVETPE